MTFTPPTLKRRPPVTGRVQAIIAVILFTICASPFCENPLLMALSGAVATLALALLWRPGEPPLMLLPAGFQFLQVTIALYYATFTGRPLWTTGLYGTDLTSGILAGLLGLTALIVGMRLGNGGISLRRKPHPSGSDIAVAPFSAFVLCLLLFAISVPLAFAGGAIPALRQPLVAMSAVKWAGVYFLAYNCFRLKSGYHYVLAVVLLEVSVGFLGFFSAFKEVFFVVFMGFISARARLKLPDVGMLVGMAVILLGLGLFWTSIRSDYRNFLNEGNGAQVVLRPVGERLSYLGDQIGQIGSRQSAIAPSDTLVRRTSYVEFLSMTIRNVPAALPHTDGKLLGGSILHIVTPRILFPNKPPLPNDTELTIKYTGMALGGSTPTFASISIGYVGELFIDFGYLGIVAGCLVLGMGYGAAYRYFISSPTGLMAMNAALALMVLMTGLQFEKSLIKTIGSSITAFFAAAVLKRAESLVIALLVRLAKRRRRAGYSPVTPAE